MTRFSDAAPLAGLLITAAVLISWAFILFAPQEQLPVGAADGIYANSCCGDLILSSGEARIGLQAIGYVIERDKQGPYVLPIGRRVEADTKGISVAQGKPLKLRLDTASSPHWIDLPGPNSDVRFMRKH